MKMIAVVLLLALVLAAVLFAVAGCGGDASGADTVITTTAPSPTSGTQYTTQTEGGDGGSAGSSDKVFEPHELLSAEEASAIVGLPVTLDGSVDKEPDVGGMSERYAYEQGMSSVLALFQIYEDGYRTGPGSAKEDFLSTKALTKDDQVEPVKLGDDSFVMRYGQVHVLYGSYYLILAFNADDLDDSKDIPLNTRLAEKVLENLKAKLGS